MAFARRCLQHWRFVDGPSSPERGGLELRLLGEEPRSHSPKHGKIQEHNEARHGQATHQRVPVAHQESRAAASAQTNRENSAGNY